MTPLTRLFATSFLLLFAIATRAQVAGAERIESVTLDNGMTLIVWPDADIPNVALYNWVSVGSRNEVPGITGLAHFFEHMMFNGTSTRQPGAFDKELEASGARNNASTSSDVTIYQDWFPGGALELVFDLESDRLRNLAFDPKVIESERGVVYSERRLSVDDNNFGRLMEQVTATAFIAHPYSIPTIGWPSDIENWSIDDLKKFFATHYAPNNCTMILVGDVDPKQVITLAHKYFDSIPRQPAPDPIRTKEPEQHGERRVRVEAEAQTPLLQFAYHSVAGGDPRVPALELLARVLTDGDASRLHRALVEEQKLAISVDSHVESGFDPGLFWLFVALPAQGDLDRTEKAFDTELDRIRTQGVTAAELSRARNQALADFWRGMATIDGKAEALGSYAVIKGGYRKLFDAPREYEKVTIDDLKKLANDLLQQNNRTVGVLASAAKEAR
ncbi:MAG: M16 family metallopeptidase [Povalibacter sp.]